MSEICAPKRACEMVVHETGASIMSESIMTAVNRTSFVGPSELAVWGAGQIGTSSDFVGCE